MFAEGGVYTQAAASTSDVGQWWRLYYGDTITNAMECNGTILIGGDVSGSNPNIELNANGSGTFVGNVLSGDSSGTYFSIQSEGRCEVQAADATTQVALFSNAVTGTTSTFQADGSASFASTSTSISC